jgi:hypothetical protein
VARLDQQQDISMAESDIALPARFSAALHTLRTRLPEALGENLFSLILYGSAVRDDLVANGF